MIGRPSRAASAVLALVAAYAAGSAAPALGQDAHGGHSGHPSSASPPSAASAPAEPAGTEPAAHAPPGDDHDSLMTGPLGIPRNRNGSGTSWLPDASPMYGHMAGAGGSGFMLHYNVFAGYDWFDSRRGSDRFISVNSVMGAAWHRIGPGEIMLRTMLSLEPLTVGSDGYPLILQSGETSGGEPLHDRQHPHDFFMELAAQYTLEASDGLGLVLYVAPAGEPALGPTAFPHRVSAMPDPLAPIGHHWQDSTHIAFGVLTAALFTETFKVDASWFNGREPDEERWDIDLRVPDSYAGRLTWNPHESLSLQTSYGFLRSPEALDPQLSVHRVTASLAHNVGYGRGGNLASTFVFGENIPERGTPTPAVLIESAWSIDRHHTLFGRAEYVQKSGHDLVLPDQLEEETFATGLLGLGYAYHLGPFAHLQPGIGIRGSLGLVDRDLEEFYGTRVPVGLMVFAQLRPAAMDMDM